MKDILESTKQVLKLAKSRTRAVETISQSRWFLCFVAFVTIAHTVIVVLATLFGVRIGLLNFDPAGEHSDD